MPASFVLLLVAVLAAADPAAPVRIPGTKFSLGMNEEQLRPGDFIATQDGGEIARQGAAKFFGLPCQAKLYFRDGRLERAKFEADSVTPQNMDYVENQMRGAKLWRECARLEPADRVCDWLGAVRIHFEYRHARMAALVTVQPQWTEDAAAPVAVSAEPPAGTGAEPSAAAQSNVATIGAKAPPEIVPGLATATGAVGVLATAPPTGPAPQTQGLAPTTPAQTATMPSTQAAPPAAMATTAAATMDTAADHVAVLPETLRISLPGNNPPTVWPRMVAIPTLEYPEPARATGAQGIVWVMALVDADGRARTARVEHAGIPGLNEAALAWVSKAHFAPCERDGQPCRFWVRVAARFVPS